MPPEIVLKKISSRIYLEMMPRISDYSKAQELARELIIKLTEKYSEEEISSFLFKVLGAKIQNFENSQKLAQILIQDYEKLIKN